LAILTKKEHFTKSEHWLPEKIEILANQGIGFQESRQFNRQK
jgi:hypothetical protein